MKTSGGHLTYCTNIHPGETWPDHFAALKLHFPAIKNVVCPSEPMGIGLRLSHVASEQLTDKIELELFKDWLQDNNAYVFTMNGFPYGGFHHTIVKDQVHAPDWTTTARVDYTKRLFDILAVLLPTGMEGGVSTSPLSYRHWFPSPDALGLAKEIATAHIIDVALHLIAIYRATGKKMHLDIEPEPDGLLETGKEFIDWFQNDLMDEAIRKICSAYPMSHAEAEKVVKEHICICYDICHFAVGYEEHIEVINELGENGIKIGKIQISAALKAFLPDNGASRTPVKEAFEAFNESTYLHQVIAQRKDGAFIRYPDLPNALDDAENKSVIEWRAHFHVPIFENDFGLLTSTQSDIITVLDQHKNHAFSSHLEIETYTWEVLADSLKLPIEKSIIRELQWVKSQLSLQELRPA